MAGGDDSTDDNIGMIGHGQDKYSTPSETITTTGRRTARDRTVGVSFSNDSTSIPPIQPSFSPTRSSAAPSPLSSAAPTILTIENTIPPSSNNNNNNNRSVVGSAAGLLVSKYTVMGAIAVLAVGSTGLWGWLLGERLNLQEYYDEVARLEDQVNRLKGEVDGLSDEIDRLDGQVDRLEDENDRLELLNDDLENQTIFLNATVREAQRQTIILNASVQEQKQLVAELGLALDDVEEINEGLNGRVNDLNQIVYGLQQSNQNLNISLQSAQMNNENLAIQTQILFQLQSNLTSESDILSNNIQRLDNITTNYQQIVNNLESNVSFLRDEAIGLNQSVAAMISFLASSIHNNRHIFLKSIEAPLIVQRSYFPCRFGSRFGSEDRIGDDYTMSIGSLELYNEIRDWIDSEYISDLCGNITDFEAFLLSSLNTDNDNIILLVDMTSLQLDMGYDIYSRALLDYYFPDRDHDYENVPALTQEDWVNVDYDCRALSDDKRFVYSRDVPSSSSS